MLLFFTFCYEISLQESLLSLPPTHSTRPPTPVRWISPRPTNRLSSNRDDVLFVIIVSILNSGDLRSPNLHVFRVHWRPVTSFRGSLPYDCIPWVGGHFRTVNNNCCFPINSYTIFLDKEMIQSICPLFWSQCFSL